MKRFILVILVMAVIASTIMVGCSSSNTTTPASTTSTAPTTTTATSSAPAATTTSSAPATSTAATSTAAGGKTWKLRFAYEQATTSYYHLYLWEPLAKDIEQATNGRVTLELYPSQTLMKSTDSFEGVKSGMADMSFIIPAYFPGKFPVINLLQLPFGASTSAGASQIAWSMYEKFPEMRQMFDGFKVVSLWTTEPMYLHGAKKNYKTLDDFAGQQIRASAGAATDLANGLGGNAVFIGMGETYQNLQKGVVDSVITPSEGAMGFRIYEVAPYTTHFPGVPAVHMVVMNQKVWDSMPADIQQALNGVFGVNLMKKAAAVADMAAKDMPVKVKEAGLELHEYTVPNDELAKWVEKAGTPMRKAWLDSVAAAGVTNGQEMLDEYLKIAATVK